MTGGSVSQADDKALQAPFRSGIDVDDYQLDPVVRALPMPRVNLLIADDVGLGKTIEAGLVAQELILRHRARTILIICPLSIQVQWKKEMRDKFGLEFRIVDRALLGDLRRKRGIHVNPWAHFPRLITSHRGGTLLVCLPAKRLYLPAGLPRAARRHRCRRLPQRPAQIQGRRRGCGLTSRIEVVHDTWRKGLSRNSRDEAFSLRCSRHVVMAPPAILFLPATPSASISRKLIAAAERLRD